MSQNQDQGYKAGEAKGQNEEKASHMMDTVKDTAQGAKDKTCETAQAAKDKTASMGQTGKDKTCETTQEGKEKTAGIGEKVMGAAQGAADAVKNAFGVNDDQKK